MLRRCILGLATTLCVAQATPSFAGGYSGYFLATFSVPGGATFSHCFHLTRDNSVSGYRVSGVWKDTDFIGKGEYVVAYRHLHLAGFVKDPSGDDYLTLDGYVIKNGLSETTFDYFSPKGVIFAAGKFSEMLDSSCKNPA